MERAHKKGNEKGEVEGKEEDRRVVSVVKAGRCSRGCAAPVTRRRYEAGGYVGRSRSGIIFFGSVPAIPLGPRACKRFAASLHRPGEFPRSK